MIPHKKPYFFAVFPSYAKNYHVFLNITLEFSLLVRGFYGSAMLQADKCKVAMINVCIGRKIPILSSLYVYILSWHSIIENPPHHNFEMVTAAAAIMEILLHPSAFETFFMTQWCCSESVLVNLLHPQIYLKLSAYIYHLWLYKRNLFAMRNLCRTTSDTYLLYIF